jgi:hypothetical protein
MNMTVVSGCGTLAHYTLLTCLVFLQRLTHSGKYVILQIPSVEERKLTGLG